MISKEILNIKITHSFSNSYNKNIKIKGDFPKIYLFNDYIDILYIEFNIFGNLIDKNCIKINLNVMKIRLKFIDKCNEITSIYIIFL